MNLLFTGASGFLGKNIIPLLNAEYSVRTMGLSGKDDFKVNLATTVPDLKYESFDVVLHAAGKAHSVPKTEAEERVFYDVNLQGTINLCKGLENTNMPKALIFISTVAVYGREFGEGIDESHSLNGDTPYAKSKIEAEKYLTEWCGERGVELGIIRPSLITGPNPPGNLGAMIKGIRTGRYLSISGGKSHKSVLMVQDIARMMPALVEKGGVYNVCDDRHPTFAELEDVISKQLGKKKPASIPFGLAKIIAKVGDLLGSKAPINTLKLKKITESLTFSNEKAKRELGWKPLDVLDNFKIG